MLNELMAASLDKLQHLAEPQKSSIEAHESLLYISNISRSDAGLYICSARNSIGESRTLLQIDVMCMPANFTFA